MSEAATPQEDLGDEAVQEEQASESAEGESEGSED